jgi:hypothetical protein
MMQAARIFEIDDFRMAKGIIQRLPRCAVLHHIRCLFPLMHVLTCHGVTMLLHKNSLHPTPDSVFASGGSLVSVRQARRPNRNELSHETHHVAMVQGQKNVSLFCGMTCNQQNLSGKGGSKTGRGRGGAVTPESTIGGARRAGARADTTSSEEAEQDFLQ